MTKEKRVNFLSSHWARIFPYACSTRCFNDDKWGSSFLPAGDEKDCEEARCPICMEHPYNAFLLHCSSCEQGYRPYMCDKRYRHSDSLDHFTKLTAMASPSDVK